MRRVYVFAALLVLGAPGLAQAQYYGTQNYGYGSGYGGYGTGSNPNSHYVQPHFNSNGTYTSGHYRTNPNTTRSDNYGTMGNYNPYTGRYGTR